MSETRTVAVLGTGIMGAAMARNLLRAGHAVRAWNRGPAKAEPLAQDGAVVAATPAEAVEGADVVLTMLHDAAAVTQVVREAAPGLRAGTAWVQSTTVGVDDAPALAALADELGVTFYEAPVSGTRQPAEAGKLVVIAAGPVAGRAVVEPVLDAVGARTVWTGEDGATGSATRLKLVVNSWVITVANAAGEVLALARALDVDPDRFFEVLAGGPLDTPFLRAKTDLVREDRLSPASFAVGTSRKDAHLIVAAAQERGLRLDGAEAFAARLDRAAEPGRTDEDMAATFHTSTVQED
jgi:3-hydroxyisobutyrate dehydrogenase